MSYHKGGQWSYKEDHWVGDVVDAYAADVTVAKASTPFYTTVGAAVDVSGASVVAVMCEMASLDAGAADDVVFYIEASIDGTTYSSEGDSSTLLPYLKVTIEGLGVGTVQKLTLLDVRGIHYIRVDKIDNQDASHDCTANVHFSVVH